MRESQLFLKTKREAPKGVDSVNHELLVRGGFIDQLTAGSWTLLPLGLRVINNINGVIREEMNNIGTQEISMPLLTPRSIWDETGRWEKAKDIMYQFTDSRHKQHGLAFTHEEVAVDLLRKTVRSYQDLPQAIYHFSTKFRNEPRAKGGILRGREFIMKDLYSVHSTEKDLMNFYDKVKSSYSKIFERLGIGVRVIEASGGVFTNNHTHEFQVPVGIGEDTIYFCRRCDWGQNKEIFNGAAGDVCPKCERGKVDESKAIEVANIFPLGTWFSEKMNFFFEDNNGQKKPVWFGSYGIGSTRTMGAYVEISHDNNGIIWNKTLSPFDVQLIGLPGAQDIEQTYERLTRSNLDVLYDDRNIPAGQKFADADLIGIPVRLVASGKTKNQIEWKNRNSNNVEMLNIEQVVRRLKTRK